MDITKNKKGFTLIELLVVIAIIGILSGTVIVSMRGTQETAKDSRVNSALGQMRTAAEVYKFGDGLGSYDNFRTMDQVVLLIAEITANGKGGTAPVIYVDSSSWCASQALNASGAGVSCIDYRGYTVKGVGIACDATAGSHICTGP